MASVGVKCLGGSLSVEREANVLALRRLRLAVAFRLVVAGPVSGQMVR